MRPIVKGEHARGFVHFDEVRVQRMIIRMQKQGGVCPGFLVRFPDAAQVHVHHRVAVEHDEAFRQQLASSKHRARRAERLALRHVANAHTPLRAVAEMFLDEVRAIMNEEDQVSKAMRFRQL